MKSFVSYKKEKWDEYLKYKIQLEHKIIEFKQIKKNFVVIKKN